MSEARNAEHYCVPWALSSVSGIHLDELDNKPFCRGETASMADLLDLTRILTWPTRRLVWNGRHLRRLSFGNFRRFAWRAHAAIQVHAMHH